MKSLTRNADQRYQTAAEFATALREFRKAYALPAPEIAPPAPVAADVPGAAALPGTPNAAPLDMLEALAGEVKAAIAPVATPQAASPDTIGLKKPPAVPSPPVPRAEAAPAPVAPAAEPPRVEPPAPTPDPTPLFRMMRGRLRGREVRPPPLHERHGAPSLYFVRGLILYGTSDVEGEHWATPSCATG